MKSKPWLILISLMTCALTISGCANSVHGAKEASMDMPNPASVYCEEQGGDLDIRTDAQGEYGVCIFDDGSECEEWAFYRGECATRDGTDDRESAPQGQAPESTRAGIANPASVYCEEQGGHLDIHTDAEGNQIGMCSFDDGSVCEEWAFFRSECQPESTGGAPRLIYGWAGYVVTPPADQADDAYFVLSPKEAGAVGLFPMNDDIAAAVAALRDSDQLIHVWGALNCEIPKVSGCRLEITRIRPAGSTEITDDAVEGWQGTLKRLPDGAQFDDAFVLSIPGFPVQYGIDAREPLLADTLSTLRDTGQPFFIFGVLQCGVIDVNGCQIIVDRIEGIER